MARRERAVCAGIRHIDGEVMAAELQHPWRRRRWRAENRHVIFRAPELHGGRRRTAGRGAPFLLLVAADDVVHFLQAFGAQGRAQERLDRIALRRAQVAETQPVARQRRLRALPIDLHHRAGRQVRPSGLQVGPQLEHHGGALGGRQGRQERIRRGHRTRGAVGGGRGLRDGGRRRQPVESSEAGGKNHEGEGQAFHITSLVISEGLRPSDSPHALSHTRSRRRSVGS